MSEVNPAGFDMRNALSADDIVFPRTDDADREHVAALTWGRMIVAYREAGMNAYLRAVPANGFAKAAAERIGRVMRRDAGNAAAAIY